VRCSSSNQRKEDGVFSGQPTKVDIKSGYSLSEEAIAALQSGDIQRLIDSRNTGLVMMAKDDGDDGDDDSDDDDDSSDSGDSGSGDDDTDDDDDSSGDDDGKVTKADLERMEKRMKAADKRASEAEARLRKIDDDKKDDLTKATDRVTELEGEVQEKDETIKSLRLKVGFLSSNVDIQWHNPGTAMRLAQTEGYLDDIADDKGEINQDALNKALKKFAKDNEYLVKPRSGAGPSGQSSSSRSDNGKDDKQVEEEDKRRAPALSRRR
jgi:hypothetical protein